MTPSELPLSTLADHHFGVTRELADSYCQGAHVSLERHHSSPVLIRVSSEFNGSPQQADYTVTWNHIGERARAAWANEDDATRDGAYAVSLAALEIQCSLVAVSRAPTKSGADYYVNRIMSFTGAGAVDLPDLLEGALRLEVSGVDHGDVGVIESRLRQKKEQTRRGQGTEPAIATVVGFAACLVRIADVT